MRLWDANGASVDQAVLAFTVGDDPVLDRELLPFDCLASAAHARMLHEMGILRSAELEAVLDALAEARRIALADRFEIALEQEDGHTALELFLVERAGEAGRKIHTGRSRNDQVIAALRLLIRERLVLLGEQIEEIAHLLLDRSETERETALPGYTHTRQAMPSTVGQLLSSVAEGLTADLELFLGPLALAHRSALGSASGYGVPLPLRRERISQLLGLERSDINTLYVQNTRGRLESATLGALHQASLTLGRFASDLIWFSSEAFGFVSLPVELTTGSSIMPQKRNPDLLELARAVPASMLARYTEVTATLHGLPAGYHRDLQRTKAPLLAGLRDVRALLAVMGAAARGIEFDRERCANTLREEIFATDRVYALVRGGAAFRDAYREVKERGADSPVRTDPESSPIEFLAARTHLGAPGTRQEEWIRDRLREVAARLQPYAEGAATARALLDSAAQD